MSENTTAHFMHRIAIKRGLLASRRGIGNRAARIARLRSAIMDGEYHVSCAQLAARLLVNQPHMLDANVTEE